MRLRLGLPRSLLLGAPHPDDETIGLVLTRARITPCSRPVDTFIELHR